MGPFPHVFLANLVDEQMKYIVLICPEHLFIYLVDSLCYSFVKSFFVPFVNLEHLNQTGVRKDFRK